MKTISQRMFVYKASAGTGKTYTLSAHYIALLMNNVPCKNILAVTFTNKATEEMKQRIITYLNAIANYNNLDATKSFLECVRQMSELRGLDTFSDAEYCEKAKGLLHSSMSNFDDLSITTIDSFLQTLLTGMAQAIGQTATFGVELDSKQTINTAVNEVVSSDVAEQDAIMETVKRCLLARQNKEDKWDFRPGLIKLVEELYHENVQMLWEKIPITSNQIAKIQLIDAQLEKCCNGNSYQNIKVAYDKIKHLIPQLAATGGRNYNSFFRKCESLLDLKPEDVVLKNGLSLGDNDLKRLGRPEKLAVSSQDCQLLCEQITIICEQAKNLLSLIKQRKLYSKYLNELLLAGYVLERINKDLRENNTMLLCQTAYTLIQAISKHDAQFILMKAGIRYKHIMLDEFQDTSSLQWQNFRLLIEEILSAIDGSALIVGDVKQSIYRWRNGDYEIMNGLGTDSTLGRYYNPQQLSRNFRSRKEIVGFNIETFYNLSKKEAKQSMEIPAMYDEGYNPDKVEPLDTYYVPSKSGGYVYLRSFHGGNSTENAQAKEQMLEYMFGQMENLLSHDYRKKDMLILCRTSRETKQVIKTFNKVCQDKSTYPNLHEAHKIVSNDSFHLESSIAVNTIICALQYIVRKDLVAKHYLLTNHPSADIAQIEQLDTTLPLTDLVEQIIRTTLCVNGKYAGEDIAHLNCLQDKIRGYIVKYGSDVEHFLQYWDDIMHASTIPASESDDIHIMTIHSAKGLQAKNVFIPFCAWEAAETSNKQPVLWCPLPPSISTSEDMLLPVQCNMTMKDVEQLNAIYETERIKQRIDALNLLYVACTRAEDNLYLLVNNSGKARETVGQWLVEQWGEEYSRGEIQYPEPKQGKGQPIPEPFSFENAKKIPADYCTTNASIMFRQSQETQQMMQMDKTLDEMVDNIQFGNLCHAILEHIQTSEDAQRVIDDFYLRGAIPTLNSKQQIGHLIDRLLHHPIACEWYQGKWQLLREDTILSLQQEGTSSIVRENRMDCVMIQGENVVVLDYKFGKPKPQYVVQVQDYMRILYQMGYKCVKGYLWYAFQGELVEVSPVDS